MSPLGCTNFKDGGIKEIHASLLCLMSEYYPSSNHLRYIQLCERALSNIYIDFNMSCKE